MGSVESPYGPTVSGAILVGGVVKQNMKKKQLDFWFTPLKGRLKLPFTNRNIVFQVFLRAQIYAIVSFRVNHKQLCRSSSVRVP